MVFEEAGKRFSVSRDGADVMVISRDFVAIRRGGVWRTDLPVYVPNSLEEDSRAPVLDRPLASRLFREALQKATLASKPGKLDIVGRSCGARLG